MVRSHLACVPTNRRFPFELRPYELVYFHLAPAQSLFEHVNSASVFHKFLAPTSRRLRTWASGVVGRWYVSRTIHFVWLFVFIPTRPTKTGLVPACIECDRPNLT